MAWVRIDDSFPDHPKVIGLSDKAFRLYITALCYSNRYLTDGILPLNTVKSFANSRHISSLVASNLWELSENFIPILSYDEYQFTKERVLTKRESDRKRLEKHRSKVAGNSDVTPLQTDLKLRPIPIPIPIPNKDKDIPKSPTEIEFDSFWEVYPRRQAKGAALVAWKKALKKVSAQTIIDGAIRFSSDPNRNPEFTPHATTWLNQERWADEALPEKSSNQTRTESSVMRALEIAQKFVAEDGRALENDPF